MTRNGRGASSGSLRALIKPIVALSTVLYLPWLTVLGAPLRYDSIKATLPWWTFAKREIFAGRLPVWDPDRLAGTPHIANIQAGFFYPINWLLIPLPTSLTIGMSLALHIALAGIFIAVLARSFDVDDDAASLAGMAYAAGGFASARMHAGHLAVLQAMTWAPLLLVAARRLALTGDRHWAGVLAIAVWLSILAGYPAVTVYSVAIAVVLFTLSIPRGEPRARRVSVAVICTALGTAAAAPALWPLMTLVSQSTRAHLGVPTTEPGSFRWIDLPILVWPEYFGAEPIGSFWTGDPWLWHEIQSGSSVLTAALALLGISARRHERPVRGLTVLLAISLALALAGGTPISRWMYTVAPPLRMFRISARFIVFWALLVPVLTAIGFQRFIELPSRDQQRVLGRWLMLCNLALLGELVLLGIGLTHGTPPPEVKMTGGTLLGISNVAASALAVVALRSIAARRPLDPAKTSAYVRRMRLVVVAELVPLALMCIYTPFNVSLRTIVDELGAQNLATMRASDGRAAFESDYVHCANLGDVLGFHSATAWDPLLLDRTVSLLRAHQTVQDPWGDTSNFVLLDHDGGLPFDVLGIRYFVRHTATGAALDHRSTYLPRLSFVEHARIASSAWESLSAILAPGFDPHREVVLERPAATLGGDITAGIPATTSVVVSREQPGLVQADIDAATDGYLVFSESYFPGWQAESNGHIAALAPADHAIMSVGIRRGRHSMTLRFTTPWLLPCLACTALSLGVIAALLLTAGGRLSIGTSASKQDDAAGIPEGELPR